MISAARLATSGARADTSANSSSTVGATRAGLFPAGGASTLAVGTSGAGSLQIRKLRDQHSLAAPPGACAPSCRRRLRTGQSRCAAGRHGGCHRAALVLTSTVSLASPTPLKVIKTGAAVQEYAFRRRGYSAGAGPQRRTSSHLPAASGGDGRGAAEPGGGAEPGVHRLKQLPWGLPGNPPPAVWRAFGAGAPLLVAQHRLRPGRRACRHSRPLLGLPITVSMVNSFTTSSSGRRRLASGHRQR